MTSPTNQGTTMFRITLRDGRTPRAFAIAALAALGTLGACADEPVAPIGPNMSRPLAPNAAQANAVVITVTNNSGGAEVGSLRWALAQATGDRKSTRLNSSHLVISYAVFCLKKK